MQKENSEKIVRAKIRKLVMFEKKIVFVLFGRKMSLCTVIVKFKLFFSLAHISAYLVKNRTFKTSKYFGQGVKDCYMVDLGSY